MREQYLEQLKQLHEALIEMGSKCRQAIELAIQALTNDDKNLIIKEQTLDEQIDKMEREIEDRCLRLLLKQQPVASDLRDISAALKMISDMERIGDQASDIAELAGYLQGQPQLHKTVLEDMAAEATKMVRESITAFVQRDVELANQVIAYDDVVDQYFEKMKTEIATLLTQEPTQSAYGIDLLMVAKYLERIADHATNIAEWAQYAVLGKRPKDGIFVEMYID